MLEFIPNPLATPTVTIIHCEKHHSLEGKIDAINNKTVMVGVNQDGSR